MARPKFIDSIFAGLRGKGGSSYQPLGASGTAIYAGTVDQRERNPELSGDRRWRTFTELIANVSIVAASLRYLANLVGKSSWSVVPPKDGGKEAEEIAETIEKILFKDMLTPWPRVIRRASLFKPYGFSAQEWTATRREDGKIGFLDIEQRPVWTIEKWDTDLSGTVHGLVQRPPQSGSEIYLPRTRLLYLADDTFTDAPDGMGLLRHIAPTAKRLATLERLEIFGYETDLRGIPIGRAPYAALKAAVKNNVITAEDAKEAVAGIEETVQNCVRDAANGPMGLLLDSLVYASQDEANTPSTVYQYGIELLKGESNAHEVVAQAIQRMMREIARVLGTEGLLLGESGSGSLAMSKDKSTTFGMQADSTLGDVADMVNKDAINPLFMLNGWDPKLKPELRPEKIQHRDVMEITGALRDMSTAGALLDPEDPAINAVRTLLGLPEQIVVQEALRPKIGPDGKPIKPKPGEEGDEGDGDGAPADPDKASPANVKEEE